MAKKLVVCLTVVMLMFCDADNVNAAHNDNLRLEIGAGKPAASPNIAVVNEQTTINFKVWVVDTVTRKEVVHLNLKQCTYKVECKNCTIQNITPNMTISADKPNKGTEVENW